MSEPKNMFNDKQEALDMALHLLRFVELIAKRDGLPFLAVIEHDLMLGCYHHFPEGTASELKAAWYELVGPEEEA